MGPFTDINLVLGPQLCTAVCVHHVNRNLLTTSSHLLVSGTAEGPRRLPCWPGSGQARSGAPVLPRTNHRSSEAGSPGADPRWTATWISPLSGLGTESPWDTLHPGPDWDPSSPSERPNRSQEVTWAGL